MNHYNKMDEKIIEKISGFSFYKKNIKPVLDKNTSLTKHIVRDIDAICTDKNIENLILDWQLQLNKYPSNNATNTASMAVSQNSD